MFPFPLKTFSPINHIWNSFSTRSNRSIPCNSSNSSNAFIGLIKLIESIFIRISSFREPTMAIVCVLLIGFPTGNCSGRALTKDSKLKMLNIQWWDNLHNRMHPDIYKYALHSEHRTMQSLHIGVHWAEIFQITVIIIKCYDCKKFYVWQFLFGKWRITIYRSDTVYANSVHCNSSTSTIVMMISLTSISLSIFSFSSFNAVLSQCWYIFAIAIRCEF